MSINNKGIVIGDNNDVVEVYKEKLVDGFGKGRDDLFREILKTIIRDNAKCTKAGKIKLKTTVKAIFDYHGVNKPMCVTCDAEEKYITKVVDNFQNWIVFWEDEKISISSKTPSSSQIIKSRDLLIDFLLYFNYKQFQGSYKDNVKKFNQILDEFNYGPLYLMNYQEFCVLAAFKLVKDGEDVYSVYNNIYNNSDFAEIIKAPATQLELDEYEDYTSQIVQNFDCITDYGSKDDPLYVISGGPLTLYQFVRIHRLIFGRAHLGSYKLLCDIILDEDVSIEQSDEGWDDKEMEAVEDAISKKLRADDNLLSNLFIREYNNVLWNAYFDRRKSVSKELLIRAMILCLNSKNLKRFCSRSELSAPDVIAKKIFNEIDIVLRRIGESSLNGNFSKEEFLLVNSIYHVDYKKLYNSKEVYYPYREYVLENNFFDITAE